MVPEKNPKKRREAKGEVEVGDAFKAQEPAAKARKKGGGDDAELDWVACNECEEWFAVTKEKYGEISKKEYICCEDELEGLRCEKRGKASGLTDRAVRGARVTTAAVT